MAANKKVLEKNFSEPATFRQCKAFAYACQEMDRLRTGKKDPAVYQEVFEKVWKEQKEGTLTKGECSELIDHAKNGGTVPEKFFEPSPPKPTSTDGVALGQHVGSEWLSLGEVTELCDMGCTKVYRLIKRKQFPPSHPLPRTPTQRGGALRRWKVEEVEAWLKTKETQTTKPRKNSKPKRSKTKRNIESIIETLTIEDNIPIPRPRAVIKSPFVGLKVDQSFFIPSESGKLPLYVGLSLFRKAYPRRKIVQRFRVENGVLGHRYWRTK